MAGEKERTGGDFWQNCQNRKCDGTYKGSKGRRAQAMLTPKGTVVLCRPCQVAAQKRGEYLEQPDAATKKAMIAAAHGGKKVAPRQRAKIAAKATAKATGKKRPARKAA